MMAGTPVIAYKGGGYLETVVDPSTGSGRFATGVFVEELTIEKVKEGMRRVEMGKFGREGIIAHAEMFSKERFLREISKLVEREWEKKRGIK
jgi:glycosyltransferase involved in cell wall biosynthesis